ncbi:MAG: Shedu anti-phage system protein SduA domain-containing protein [Methanotrichaceae archaeon]|jgi:hypothetical protein
MPIEEEYLKEIIDGLSIRELCEVGSTLIQEDLENETYGHSLMETEEETYSQDGQRVTLGISGPSGPDPNNRFLDYYIGIAAPFGIKSLSHKKEIDALANTCYEFASQSLEDFKSKGWHGPSVYLVTNLEMASIEWLNEDDYLTKKLDFVRERLEKNYSMNIGNVGVFAEENIIDAAKDFENLERSILDLYTRQHGRLVLVHDEVGEEFHVENSLLLGTKCVSLGETSIISKISLPQEISLECIEHLEELINSADTKEQDLQEFFQDHEELLTRDEYLNVYPQCILTREDESVLRPDFILEPAGGPLSTILDIKLPSEQIIIKKKNRPRFSAKVYEYISQMREYGKYFDSSENRRKFEKKYRIKGFKPRLVLIIGRDYSSIDYQLFNQLRADLKEVEIMTYDELLLKCKKLAKMSLP